MAEGTFRIPSASWRRRFDDPLDGLGKPAGPPDLANLIRMLPMIVRLVQYQRRRKATGFDPISLTAPAAPGAYQGVPLGGIGAGSIGRGWRGDFRRWQLRAGRIHQAPIPADAFSVFVQREEGPGEARALFPNPPGDGSLSAWRWGLPPYTTQYAALFPRAWTIYEDPLPGLRLTCRQLSPVIGHNYRESSLPVCEFRWLVENTGESSARVGLMFSFENSYGDAPSAAAGGHWNQPFTMNGARGILLRHIYRQEEVLDPARPDALTAPREQFQDPLSFAIACMPEAGLHASACARFPSNGGGEQIWEDFTADGMLDSLAELDPSAPGERIGAAVALTAEIPAGETREMAFALAWDMPIVRFGSGAAYHRRYTTFYGANGDAAPRMAADALLRAGEWEQAVEDWQAAILADDSLPAWYRQALFNELYYVVDGGTVWCHPLAPAESAASTENSPAGVGVDSTTAAPKALRGKGGRKKKTPALTDTPTVPAALHTAMAPLLADALAPKMAEGAPAPHLPAEDVGRFAYLEGHDYRMYNTYDVHFYASWALLQNWPALELSLQRDIAAATLLDLPETFTELYHGRKVARKRGGAVPHDIGWPDEDPWNRPNGYFLHDVNEWKDLAPKLALQVYRDYAATGSKDFALEVWPAVEAAMRRARAWDRDGDGLIENDGFPDQTYDVWSARGPSAYTGGLWLAALAATARLADLAGDALQAQEYRAMLECGQAAYEERLWNGRYFAYDASRSRHHDSIMADQLAGQWYARACGLPSIVRPLYARSALTTIYDWNVQRFQGGSMGAVNGMRPDGTVDRASLQSQEVWTGTTYALAAAMLHEGMRDAAFATAWGVYHITYEQGGYWFQTPEAWDASGRYRAIAYMRPLAIWAMQWALRQEGRFDALQA
jgi:non-lysosomal glucosylceramidase